MNKCELPIGVLDSGVGGISVLRELVRLMPGEDFVYYGDSANAPYGTKSHSQISFLAGESARKLTDIGVKAIVVACNTATSVCIDELRNRYSDMPVVGIEPALKPAVNCCDNPCVLVMATPLTLSETKFQKLCESFSDRGEIISLPCPGLMELIEQGEYTGKRMDEYLTRLFAPINTSRVTSVVLGCTHYPFAADSIRKMLPHAKIFDGGAGTARQTKRCLEKQNLLKRTAGGSVVFLNSANDEAEIELCRNMLYNQKF